MRNRSRVSFAEARQRLALIRAMARPSAFARWSDDGTQLIVTQPAATPKRPPAASAQLARELFGLGLMAGTDATFTLTPAGHAWLRRQLASDDPFQEQHRQTRRRPLTGPRGVIRHVQVNDAESPLAWLRRRKDKTGAALLDEQQFEAGERLRRDYTFSALGPRVTASWSATAAATRRTCSGVPAGAMRDDVLAAKDRVHRALAAVGPELGRILFDVCCLLKGIEVAEADQGLPKRSGKAVLQLSLTALARHYGIIAQERTRHGGPAPVGHWGAPDYRPAV